MQVGSDVLIICEMFANLLSGRMQKLYERDIKTRRKALPVCSHLNFVDHQTV